MTDRHEGKGPAGGLRGKTEKHADLRDTQGGTFDRHDPQGGRQGEQVSERRTLHEDAQWGADVRSEPVPPRDDALPAGLQHREGPMNKTTGRHTTDPRPNAERSAQGEPTDGPMAQTHRDKMQHQEKAEGDRRG